MAYNNYRNQRNNYRSRNNDRDYNYDRDYNNIHHDDPESNSTYDYYYEDEFDNYYDDFDVNHPEEMHHERNYDRYGNQVVHIDSMYDHNNRRRSTEYYDNNLPHTSAMGARYSPRNMKQYNRLENPRSAKDALRDDMYAEGAGYSDWDTIDIYGIAGNRKHNVMQNRKHYNAPYNYDYENTEPRNSYYNEDQFNRDQYLPVKRSNIWPLDIRSGSRNQYPQKQNSQTRKNQSESQKNKRNTVSNSRLMQQNEKRNRRNNVITRQDHDEDFLHDHDMYTVRRRPLDRTGMHENSQHTGFSRYGNLSEGRYALDDYNDVFDEDATGRRSSKQSYGKAGRRNMRERR